MLALLLKKQCRLVVEKTNSRARLPFAPIPQLNLGCPYTFLIQRKTWIIGSLREFKELLYVKHLDYCLALGESISYYCY